MRILINRTDAIGDTLLSIPLGRLIKLRHPQAIIGFIVSPRSADLIPLCEGVDQVYVLNPKMPSSEKKKTCRDAFNDFKPTHFFHMGGDFTPMAVAFWKRIPFRGGLVSKLPTFFYLNKGVRQSRSQVDKHESAYNMDLAFPMGISWSEEDLKMYSDLLSPKFILDELKRIKLKEDSLSFAGKKLIYIHPGMSGHTLNWPNEFYGELANKLYKEFHATHQLIVSYTPSDLPYVEGMKKSMKEEVINNTFFFDGSLKGLVNFTYCLSLADLFIGPSTGTTHMANALRLKQVALYSPIKVQSEKRWGPFYRDDKVEVFSPEMGMDMNSISVEDIYQACSRLIKS